MNIKSNINLIRGILYLYEVIRCKSISRAAEINNIKTSNLSSMINDLEQLLGVRLIKRSSLGCTPTMQGRRMVEFATELKELIQKIHIWHEDMEYGNNTLNIFMAPNLELDDCKEFKIKHPEINLNFLDEDFFADVIVSNIAPTNKSISYTKLHIGKGIKQKIWISCNEQNPQAMAFYDFIVAKLLLLYDQSAPLSSDHSDRLGETQSKTDD